MTFENTFAPKHADIENNKFQLIKLYVKLNLCEVVKLPTTPYLDQIDECARMPERDRINRQPACHQWPGGSKLLPSRDCVVDKSYPHRLVHARLTKSELKTPSTGNSETPPT
jgi:hypothetical protein